ncbi:OSBP(oxysterol binding protein)-related protein 1C [Trifolium repens]|nr:OSBP(oxysterol binding protein)-related protein 1C [Trifolium repens]
MSPAKDRSVRVIGDESSKFVKKANWNVNRGGGNGATKQCKPFGEIHLKVSSVRFSKSDDKRLSVFTGTKTLHLRCVSREDRAMWIEALQSAKDLWLGLMGCKRSIILVFDVFDQDFENNGNRMAVIAWKSLSNEDKIHHLEKTAKRKAKYEKLQKDMEIQ